jgi:hypothetical protein
MSDIVTPPDEQTLVASGTGATYPVNVAADRRTEYSRFLPLIKWLLLIPQYIALFFLAIGAMVVAFLAFFATLFTGRYPEGMWNYMVGVHRYSLRVMAYHMLITDVYPAFSLDEQPEDEVRLNAIYPEKVARWRPLFAWLIAIPYLIVASVLVWVASICSIIAFFTILFTKEIPEGLFKMIRNALNWQLRGNFYSYWMSTEYPPFEWEE